MPEIKWIRITTSMFDDEKIKLIESMPDNDAVLIIWIKLLTLCGKVNDGGYIYFAEQTPYTDEMLATVFSRPLNTVRMALGIFKKYNMIQVNETGMIYISNWEKHQNVEGMDRIRELSRARVEKHRVNQLRLIAEKSCNVTETLRNAIDIDKNKNNILDKRDRKNHLSKYSFKGNDIVNLESGEILDNTEVLEKSEAIWQQALEEIKTKVHKISYGAWFNETHGLAITDNEFLIKVRNRAHLIQLKDNFYSVIDLALSDVTEKRWQIHFVDGAADGN